MLDLGYTIQFLFDFVCSTQTNSVWFYLQVYRLYSSYISSSATDFRNPRFIALSLTLGVHMGWVDRVEGVSRIQPDVGGLKFFQPNPTQPVRVGRVVFKQR